LNSNIPKAALFGTSADPPTNGHEIIIRELAKKYDLVITYASNNPSKEHQENLYNRSLLLKTLVNSFNNSKIIFDNKITSPWAINTIDKCKTKYHLKRLDFVIGSDLLEEIFSWKNIHDILKEVKLYIIPREGYELNKKCLDSITNVEGIFEISTFKIPKVSSSLIRYNSNLSLLPKPLIPIVKSKNLYRYN